MKTPSNLLKKFGFDAAEIYENRPTHAIIWHPLCKPRSSLRKVVAAGDREPLLKLIADEAVDHHPGVLKLRRILDLGKKHGAAVAVLSGKKLRNHFGLGYPGM